MGILGIVEILEEELAPSTGAGTSVPAPVGRSSASATARLAIIGSAAPLRERIFDLFAAILAIEHIVGEGDRRHAAFVVAVSAGD